MTRFTRSILPALAILSVLFTGCKDDEPNRIILNKRYLLSETRSQISGKLAEYFYENGSLAKTSHIGYLEGTIVTTGYYRYDEAGRTLEYAVYYNGQQESRITFEYNRFGKVASRLEINLPQTKRTLTNYNYNERGQEIEKYVISDGKTVSWDKNYQYDNAGRLIRKESYTDEGSEKPASFTTYSYNAAGKLLNEQTVWPATGNQGETISYDRYTYDDRGRENYYVCFRDNEFQYSQNNYEYDEAGNITYYETFDNTNRLTDRTSQKWLTIEEFE